MKKFLSLLLALTLVLSLVVVPARADDGPSVGGDLSITATDTTRGATNVTFTLTGNPSVTGESGAVTITNTAYSWNIGSYLSGSAGTESTTNALTAETKTAATTVSCNVQLTYTVAGSEESKQVSTTVTSNSFAIADAILDKDISTVIFKGRGYSYAHNTATVYYDAAEADASSGTSALADKTNWGVNASGVTVDNVSVSSSNVSLTLKKQGCADKVITVTATQLTAPTSVSASPATGAKTGTKVEFTLNATTSSNTKITWTYQASDASNATAFTPTKNTTTGKYEWMIPDSLETKTYTITCSLSESGASGTKVSNTTTLGVVKDENILTYNPNAAATRGSTVNLSLTFTDKSGNKVDGALSNVTWAITSGTGASLGTKAVSDDGKTASNTLTIPSNASSSYTVTAKFTAGGKEYTATYTVTVKSLTAAISPIQNNTPVTLYGYNYGYITNNNLVAIAQAALNTASISATVSYVTLDTGSRTNCYVQRTSGSSSAYYTYTITGTSIGTASFTGTVYTNKGNYPITFTATVTPISTTYEAQYPEPVAYGNTYRYYVQVPAGASYYYVVGTPNQATTPTDFSQSGKTVYYANTTSTNLYPLTDSNFVGGQCTLWIVTKNSSDNRLYYGQLTVYQKNYNINYNGVAGETVQFAQSDFNDFMNKVAEARGDASKAKSYPYVTFDYVTFSLPTTAQGTLYYGGTAMSTSNSSGAFNRNTKVTNLDSVTFVPNAKSTAKTITLNFTLYATRYSSSSTSRGTTVSYSGSVVVNLVREDIKYTVSQGDSVRFDESDFLSYLRSTKGYSSNYTIDYVTFDQSAVSAVNEGSLYTYYNGYNYGGSIKTTDKFYYNATASQNAISDVAFLASRYAKTGETVYIPFTIYARYGTTGTGTRQLTGTVAIKIGQTMNFIDVKTTDYFYNSVKWAVGKNITNGTSSTTFSPYKSCTRAEIVTFLWRAAGSPEPTTTRNPFRDVNAVTHSSYYKAILWASQKGITSGTSATAFSPDQVCTRAQIVTFLYRYAGQPSGYYSNPFKDVGATSEASYYNAILWAVGKGITTGTSATTFSPYASCNRAEAVTFLYRYTNGL